MWCGVYLVPTALSTDSPELIRQTKAAGLARFGGRFVCLKRECFSDYLRAMRQQWLRRQRADVVSAAVQREVYCLTRLDLLLERRQQLWCKFRLRQLQQCKLKDAWVCCKCLKTLIEIFVIDAEEALTVSLAGKLRKNLQEGRIIEASCVEPELAFRASFNRDQPGLCVLAVKEVSPMPISA